MNDSFDKQTGDVSDDEVKMLLAGDVLDNLDDADQARLLELAASAESVDELRNALGRLAANIGFASELMRREVPPVDEGNAMALNPQLIDRIRKDAIQYLPPRPQAELPVSPAGTPLRSFSRSPWLGWCVAASLGIVCGGMWWASRDGANLTVVSNEVSSREDVAAWLKSHPNAVRLKWEVKDPKLALEPSAEAPAGTVAFDTSSQSGYMTFQSLPINDPSQQQYQLWILDPKRDEEPVDGGVFNVTQAGETIVPIRAKLDVVDPIGFAITVEQPGGVVVSDQSRLPLLALVPK